MDGGAFVYSTIVDTSLRKANIFLHTLLCPILPHSLKESLSQLLLSLLHERKGNHMELWWYIIADNIGLHVPMSMYGCAVMLRVHVRLVTAEHPQCRRTAFGEGMLEH